MSPPPGVIELIDHLVAKLDKEAMGDEYRPGATSSYGAIVFAWERLRALFNHLDPAVSNPLAEGAASVLREADKLVGVDVDRVAFWLIHVAEAIDRGTRT
jgi:hypothetical protein